MQELGGPSARRGFSGIILVFCRKLLYVDSNHSFYPIAALFRLSAAVLKPLQGREEDFWRIRAGFYCVSLFRGCSC